MLMSAFAARISPDINIRYQLVLNFGCFLRDVVCRLGTNKALDTASEALVSAHKLFCAGYVDPDREQLVKQSQALSALRQAINDPDTVNCVETLCAVMILMIVEVRTIYSLLIHDYLTFTGTNKAKQVSISESC